MKFEEIFEILKSNLRLILISALSIALVSAIITIFFISPEYEASAKVYIGKEKFKNISTTYTSEEINMYQRLIKTYSELVKTKDLVSKSITNVGEDISVEEVLSKVKVTSIADTQILQIKYVSDSREESYDMVYGITEEFMKLSKKLYPNGNVHIIEQPIPPKREIGPNKKMNIVIGAIIGMIIGVAMIFLKVFMRNSFTDKEGLERALEVSCLGVIPKIE